MALIGGECHDEARQTEECAAELLAALGSRARLAIVHLLAAEGQLDVGGIAAEMKLSIANTSHHLTRLRMAGIVRSHKCGTRVLNTLTDRPIIDLVTRAEQMCR